MEYKNVLNQLRENIQKVIVGKDEQIKLLLTALLAKGNVLLEDTPGTGKTMLAKALATSINGEFKRVQFTPDLLPSDVTGISIYNQKSQEFEFKKGPVFCNILLADEINRATPRTQSSLLEAMAEHQVTTDGVTRRLSEPFFIIATENPIETTGTFPLPEAQLDRFDLKITMGFPDELEDMKLLSRYIDGNPMNSIEAVCSLEDLQSMQNQVQEVYIHKDVRQYIVAIIQATRSHESSLLGINPRGMLSLAHLAQSYAFLEGRNYVIPEDVKCLVKPCLSHRLFSYSGINGQNSANKLLDDIMSTIPVPTEKFER